MNHTTHNRRLCLATALVASLAALIALWSNRDRELVPVDTTTVVRSGPAMAEAPAATATPVRVVAPEPAVPPAHLAFAIHATLATETSGGEAGPTRNRLELRGTLQVEVVCCDEPCRELSLTVADADLQMADGEQEVAPVALPPELQVQLAGPTRVRLLADGTAVFPEPVGPGLDLVQRLVAMVPFRLAEVGDRTWIRTDRDAWGTFRVEHCQERHADGTVRVSKRHLGYESDASHDLREHAAAGTGEVDATHGWLIAARGRERSVTAVPGVPLTLCQVFEGSLQLISAGPRLDSPPALGPTAPLAAMAELVRRGEAKSRAFGDLIEALTAVVGNDAEAFAILTSALQAGTLDVDVARGALLAIGRSRAPGAAGFLVDHLCNGGTSVEQGMAAVEALYALRLDDATRCAVAAACACPGTGRQLMLRALLGLIPADATAESLEVLLRGEADAIAAGVHTAWLDAVARLDSASARVALDARLGHGAVEVRLATVRALQRRGGREAVRQIGECLATEQVVSVRHVLLGALCAVASDAEMEVVASALRAETDSEARAAVIAELTHPDRPRPQAVALVRDLMTRDPDLGVREVARLALGGRPQ